MIIEAETETTETVKETDKDTETQTQRQIQRHRHKDRYRDTDTKTDTETQTQRQRQIPIHGTAGVCDHVPYCFLNSEVRGVVKTRWDRWKLTRNLSNTTLVSPIPSICSRFQFFQNFYRKGVPTPTALEKA